jgi:hypothetical protein
LIEGIGEVRWQEVAGQLECGLSLQSRSACFLYSTKIVKFNEYLSSLFYSPPNLWLLYFNSLYFSLFFPFGLFYSVNFPFPFLSLLLFLLRCLFFLYFLIYALTYGVWDQEYISVKHNLFIMSLYLSLSSSLFPVCCLHFSLPYSITYSFLTSLVSPTMPDSVLSQYKESLRRPLLGNKLLQAQ